jgi:hypothetical protein
MSENQFKILKVPFYYNEVGYLAKKKNPSLLRINSSIDIKIPLIDENKTVEVANVINWISTKKHVKKNKLMSFIGYNDDLYISIFDKPIEIMQTKLNEEGNLFINEGYVLLNTPESIKSEEDMKPFFNWNSDIIINNTDRTKAVDFNRNLILLKSEIEEKIKHFYDNLIEVNGKIYSKVKEPVFSIQKNEVYRQYGDLASIEIYPDYLHMNSLSLARYKNIKPSHQEYLCVGAHDLLQLKDLLSYESQDYEIIINENDDYLKIGLFAKDISPEITNKNRKNEKLVLMEKTKEIFLIDSYKENTIENYKDKSLDEKPYRYNDYQLELPLFVNINKKYIKFFNKEETTMKISSIKIFKEMFLLNELFEKNLILFNYDYLVKIGKLSECLENFKEDNDIDELDNIKSIVLDIKNEFKDSLKNKYREDIFFSYEDVINNNKFQDLYFNKIPTSVGAISIRRSNLETQEKNKILFDISNKIDGILEILENFNYYENKKVVDYNFLN